MKRKGLGAVASAFLLLIANPVVSVATEAASTTASLEVNVVRLVVARQGSYDIEAAVRRQLEAVGFRLAQSTSDR